LTLDSLELIFKGVKSLRILSAPSLICSMISPRAISDCGLHLLRSGLALLVTACVLGSYSAQAETCGSYLHSAMDRAEPMRREAPHTEQPVEDSAPVCTGPNCRQGQAPRDSGSPVSTIVRPVQDEAVSLEQVWESGEAFVFSRLAEDRLRPIQTERARPDRPPR
jgi:hypothetical protein